MKHLKSPVWFPYAQHKLMADPLAVTSAEGVYLTLESGEKLIDSISSWWSVIHGYNHPRITQALTDQANRLPHAMLGGLIHEPAKELAQRLVDITPDGLNHVFFSDSGSVGCEVALKMALQYWINKGNTEKKRFLALNKGYHGDTFGVMAVSNPEDDCPSMHHVFKHQLPKHIFAPEPSMGFKPDKTKLSSDIKTFKAILDAHHHEIAAFICEPIMQGAGGFNMYAPDYLATITQLCRDYDVKIIYDEVATGFGRTGTLFAAHHANTCPDIMVLGKALTAGYCGHSATLASSDIFNAFYSDNPDHALMHGPTFMGNPMACRVACTSIDLFLENHYLDKIKTIEEILKKRLLNLSHSSIRSTRVLGATGVIEVNTAADWHGIQTFAQKRGVFLRPFDRFVYTTPPYVISVTDLHQICDVICEWFS
ncbi:adenosylmethionine--8-amino-7-oxononanoate transaminase [bacterium]|nr:adenosylmethionine--8-amino-7-oxononanoate transaminase [bacterium]